MTSTEKLNDSKNALREKVMQHALRIFLAEGIKSLTMSDLAASLGMSKRTLYELFADKEELLLAALCASDDKERVMLSQWAQEHNSLVTVLIHAMLKRVEKLGECHPNFFRDMLRYPKVRTYLEEQEANHQGKMLDLFRRGADEGFFRQDIDYSIVCHLVSTQMRTLFENGLDAQHSVTDTYRTIVLITLRGVTTPKGQEQMDDYLNNQ